jgi:hypothetical protein
MYEERFANIEAPDFFLLADSVHIKPEGLAAGTL